jgi:hypothetical protein
VQLQSVIQKPSSSGAPSCSTPSLDALTTPATGLWVPGTPARPFQQRDHCQRTDLALTVGGLSCPTSSIDRTRSITLARLHRLRAERAPTSPITDGKEVDQRWAQVRYSPGPGRPNSGSPTG